MSQSPPAIVGSHKPPAKIIDDWEAALADLRKVLPDDVKLLTADGEVWANRAMLSARSDYISAMFDVSKFQEGTESAGDLSQYSREVVNKVVNYCYCGVISCQDMSLSSLLSLEELLRKIILFPQSAKVKKFTVEKMTSKEFPISECLQGLVTAEDLALDTATEIFYFITANLGTLTIQRCRPMKGVTLKSGSPSMTERFNSVFSYINAQDEETKEKILPSLDMSEFSQKELSLLIRKVCPILYMQNPTVFVSKDKIVIHKDKKGNVLFYPQQIKKLRN